MCDVFNLVGIIPFPPHLSPAPRLPKPHGLSSLINSRDLSEFDLSESDWAVIAETEEEAARAGCFERIFPLRRNVDYFEQFFEIVRYNNVLVWKAVKSDGAVLRRKLKREVASDPV